MEKSLKIKAGNNLPIGVKSAFIKKGSSECVFSILLYPTQV